MSETSPAPEASPKDKSRPPRKTSAKQFVGMCLAAFLLAVVVNHLVAAKLGFTDKASTYRRIGPAEGPQIFCAGSSLHQFGLDWPEISKITGQGIENWGVPGSSPEEWEQSQLLATNANMMIIGISIYDLNEHHLCEFRANLVPVMSTMSAVGQTDISWDLTKRLLSQYPLAYTRKLFPTAGRSDAVMVGGRRILRELLKRSPRKDDRAITGVVPKEAVLKFGGSKEKVSDWPPDRKLRRLALMRSHIHGLHAFNGTKKLAMDRMLKRAADRGRVVLVVLPVSPAYREAFVTEEVAKDFEEAVADSLKSAPEALVVRLDEVTELHSDALFSDAVHLNGAGRDIATVRFLEAFALLKSTP